MSSITICTLGLCVCVHFHGVNCINTSLHEVRFCAKKKKNLICFYGANQSCFDSEASKCADLVRCCFPPLPALSQSLCLCVFLCFGQTNQLNLYVFSIQNQKKPPWPNTGGHCGYSSGNIHDIPLWMAVAEWLRHEIFIAIECTISVLVVPYLLAGVGRVVPSCRTCWFAARFHCSIHDECLGDVRSRLSGHIHCQLGRVHDHSVSFKTSHCALNDWCNAFLFLLLFILQWIGSRG